MRSAAVAAVKPPARARATRYATAGIEVK